MSEDQKAPARTYQDIQNQYTSLCNKAGHLNYQVRTHTKDLELIYDALRDLNFEAAALQAKEQQEKLAAEAVASTSPEPADKVQELPAVKKPRKLRDVKANA